MGQASSSNQHEPCDNFAQYILDEFRKHGDKDALIEASSDRSLSYNNIVKKVLRLAAALHYTNIKARDVVCVVSPNCVDYPILYLAVTWIGAIFQPLNPLYTAEDLKRTFNDTGTRLTFTTASLRGKVREASQFMHIILLDDLDAELKALESEKEVDSRPVCTDHESVMFCTSGTTGYPKAAVHSHHSALQACIATKDVFMDAYGKEVFKPGDVVVSFIPMCHIFGLHCVTMASLIMGLRVVVMERFEPQNYLNLIHKHKAVLTHIVPPIALMLSNLPKDQKPKLASVKMVVCGAAPLSSTVQKKLIDTLKEAADMIPIPAEDEDKVSECNLSTPFVMQGFGMSELTVSHCYTIKDHEEKEALGSCGRPLPGVKCKIIDVETGLEVNEPTDKGELYIQTDHMMLRYHGNPEATEDVIDPNGWLRTGDYGYIEDGYLYITDRLKDVIKYKGHQVSPGILEDYLRKHLAIQDAAVIGVPIQDLGELPKAFIVLKPEYSKEDNRPEERDIIQFIDDKVAPYMKLRGGIEFIKEIPRNPAGKILRRELRVRMDKNFNVST